MIHNPASGSASLFEELRPALASRGWELVATDAPRAARALAEQAVRDAVDVVVAAGGDGTITEVADGLVATGDAETGPALGVLPLGTGNDLARSLAVPLDPAGALAALDAGRTAPLDVIAVWIAGALHGYAVNVAAGGFSGRVDEHMSAETKERWGPLAYLFGAAKALPDLAGYETTLAYDDLTAERIDALNIIVANGRTCAGGKRVAPCADPHDGLLDVVVVRYAPLLDLAGVAARLALGGDYVDGDRVVARRVREVAIHSDPPMLFNVDGELLPEARDIRFRTLPGALRVVVGPDPAADEG